MRNILIMVIALMAVGCASAPRIQTFKEAISDNPNLESGIYNRTNGENVQVTVQSLKARIEELEKEKSDARKEADYYKRTNDELKHENMLLRVRGNYTMEREQPVLKGFDNRANPIVEKQIVNPEPQKLPEPPKAEPRAEAAPVVQAPVAQAPVAAPQAPAQPVQVAKAPEPAKAPEAVAQAPAPETKPVVPELPKDLAKASEVAKAH